LYQSDDKRARVARFFFIQNTKTGEIYQMATKLPNGHKLYHIEVIYSNVPTFFVPRPSKFYPNLDFWFENKPSGNPEKSTPSFFWKKEM
jgi:hypothetical protein